MPKLLLTSAVALSAVLPATPACAASSESSAETVEQALCRLIEGSAKDRGLPVPYLTRLIWRESSFRVGVVSPAGAQGVAQFMPGTALERGLLDPFDPEQAIPHAAHLLADLRRRFGNLGLAAAAYNGGAQRVTNWLAGSVELPAETRAYVLWITGSPAEEWRGGTNDEAAPAVAKRAGDRDEVSRPVATGLALSRSRSHRLGAPGAFSWPPTSPRRSHCEASQATYAWVIGQARPMVIGTRLRSRGTQAFYRIRIPAQNREQAEALCAKIHTVRGACLVLKT